MEKCRYTLFYINDNVVDLETFCVYVMIVIVVLITFVFSQGT